VPRPGRRSGIGSTAKNIRGTVKKTTTNKAAMAIANMELKDPAVAKYSAPISAIYDAAIIPPTELGMSGAADDERLRSMSLTGSGASAVVPNQAMAFSSTGWRSSNVSGS
jgi:hypothetical protein